MLYDKYVTEACILGSGFPEPHNFQRKQLTIFKQFVDSSSDCFLTLSKYFNCEK